MPEWLRSFSVPELLRRLLPLSHLHPGIDVVGMVILVVRELLGEGLQLCNPVILGINVTLERLVDLVQCLQ